MMKFRNIEAKENTLKAYREERAGRLKRNRNQTDTRLLDNTKESDAKHCSSANFLFKCEDKMKVL